MNPKALLIEGGDFSGYPIGGQFTFASELVRLFPQQFALVGISTDHTCTGKWLVRQVHGIDHLYFSIGHRIISEKRPIVPARWSIYRGLRRHQKAILGLGLRAAFIQSPEILMAVSQWEFDSVCYRFAGVGNVLSVSRYKWAHLLGVCFEKRFFRAFASVERILATADEDSIQELVVRSKGLLSRDRIVQFPTRVDTDVFYPRSKSHARRKLCLPEDGVVVVTTGRIHWAKGWKLLVDAFRLCVGELRKPFMCFVGDGEDRECLLTYVTSCSMEKHIGVTGRVPPESVADYVNAADIYVSASVLEGWPTSIVEAMACGKPVVSTLVSGVRDMIQDGSNGYIVVDRSPHSVANAMINALKLQNATEISLKEAKRYSMAGLKNELPAIWPILGSLIPTV